MNTNHLSELYRASIFIIPAFIILFGLSSTCLFWGWTKYDECPFEPLLTRSLIGFGLLGSISSIAALIFIIISFFEVDDSGTHLWYLLYTYASLVVYILSVTILSFWIAFVLYTKSASYQLNDQSNASSFCHTSLYNFSYGLAVIILGLVSLFSMWLVKYCSGRMYKSFFKKQVRRNHIDKQSYD